MRPVIRYRQYLTIAEIPNHRYTKNPYFQLFLKPPEGIKILRMRNLLLYICLVIPTVNSFAQGRTFTAADSLKHMFERLHSSETDQAKKSLNRDIVDHFTRILSEKSSFSESFDSLTMVGMLTAPDRSFRLFTWNIPMEGFTNEYHGLIQVRDKATGECHVHVLSNGTPLGRNMQDESLPADRWPGALYYEVHRNKDGREVYYTLLGYHFNDRFSDMKVIESLYFTPSGEPVFGKPVFRTEDGTRHRVVFEYSGEVVFNLRYNPGLKMIVYDHLAPIEPELTGHPRFYAPDFSYDGFRFRRGFWEYEAELDVRND